MMKQNEKYKFWRWLIEKAIHNKRIYYLLWGVLFVLGICAYRFGLLGLF